MSLFFGCILLNIDAIAVCVIFSISYDVYTAVVVLKYYNLSLSEIGKQDKWIAYSCWYMMLILQNIWMMIDEYSIKYIICGSIVATMYWYMVFVVSLDTNDQKRYVSDIPK